MGYTSKQSEFTELGKAMRRRLPLLGFLIAILLAPLSHSIAAPDGGPFPKAETGGRVSTGADRRVGVAADECFANFLMVAQTRFDEQRYRQEEAKQFVREIIEDAQGALMRRWRRNFIRQRGEEIPPELANEAEDDQMLRRYLLYQRGRQIGNELDQRLAAERAARDAEARGSGNARRAGVEAETGAGGRQVEANGAGTVNAGRSARPRTEASAPQAETATGQPAPAAVTSEAEDDAGMDLLLAIMESQRERDRLAAAAAADIAPGSTIARAEAGAGEGATESAARGAPETSGGAVAEVAPKTRKVKKTVRVPIKEMRTSHPDPVKNIEEFVKWATENVIVKEKAFANDEEIIRTFILPSEFAEKARVRKELKEFMGMTDGEIDLQIRDVRAQISARAQEMARDVQRNADVPWREEHMVETVVRHEERVVIVEEVIEEAPEAADAGVTAVKGAGDETSPTAARAVANGAGDLGADAASFVAMAEKLKFSVFVGPDYMQEVLQKIGPARAMQLMDAAIKKATERFPDDAELIATYLVAPSSTESMQLLEKGLDARAIRRLSIIRSEVAAAFDGQYQEIIHAGALVR